MSTKRSWLENLKYQHLVAGLSGGIISTLVLHPFDLVKVRFQVNDGTTVIKNRDSYTGLINAFSKIVKNNGFRGLYQGVSPNVAGAGASWGLYFFLFNGIKSSRKQQRQVASLEAREHLIAGALAGATTLTLTNPIWVVKTRMCLQPMADGTVVMSREHYSGVLDGLKKLYHYEGIRGCYRGYFAGLLGVSHGAFQFMAYEELKKWRSEYAQMPVNSKLNPIEYITMAALSKVFAVVTTYPYQVVRSRMQDTKMLGKYNGLLDTFKKIYKYEGMSGYYKGMVPSLIRVTPACCITFLVYENISHFLMPNMRHT